MDKKTQKRLVKDISKGVLETILRDIENGKIPESWDGIELRELLSDRVKWHNMEKRRAKDYRNTVAVNGL